MNRIFIKTITLILFAFIANTSAFAIDSEFKNTLTNVGLTKTSENSYTVNLYTSKKYSAPVKVIKKSDLSYYILLPETKNTASKITTSSPDIRNVSATLYPYAGVDVNNGYTKVDINTTKPINFSVSTKSATQQTVSNAATSTNTVAKQENIQKTTDTPKEALKTDKAPVKTQVSTNNETKKQLASTAQTQKNTTPTTTKVAMKEKPVINTNTGKVNNAKTNISKTAAPKKADTVSKAKTTTVKLTKAPAKKDVKPVVSKKVEDKLRKITTEQANLKPKAEPKTETKVEPKAEPKAEPAPEAMAAAKINPDMTENTLKEPVVTEQEVLETTNPIEEINPEKNVVSRDINVKPFFEKIKDGTVAVFSGIGSAFSNGFTALSNRLYEYGLTVFDLLFMIFAGIFSFIAVLFILSKKQNQPKLKNKSELIDKTEPSLVAKKETKESDKDSGKYFVFDNNVKQTELTVPAEAQEKKNYELVSYDPDIRINPNKPQENENDDLDIIQKILKDDDFVDVEEEKTPVLDKIEITPQENIETTPQKEQVMLKEEVKTETTEKIETKEPIKQNESVTSPIGLEHVQPAIQKEEIVEENANEPKLLASYNISPERGFMFISYNDNVSLMGFIFDDVFVLHDYKVSKLSNYNLQFRLVDKDDKSDVYIVKTEQTKLLVKVTKTSMNTEIML